MSRVVAAPLLCVLVAGCRLEGAPEPAAPVSISVDPPAPIASAVTVVPTASSTASVAGAALPPGTGMDERPGSTGRVPPKRAPDSYNFLPDHGGTPDEVAVRLHVFEAGQKLRRCFSTLAAPSFEPTIRVRVDVDASGATTGTTIVWRSDRDNEFEHCILKVVRGVAHGPLHGPVLTDVELRFTWH